MGFEKGKRGGTGAWSQVRWKFLRYYRNPQLISGHESKRSLEVYQHLSLDTVEEAYQEAVQSIGL